MAKVNKYNLAFINLLDNHYNASKDSLDYKIIRVAIDKQIPKKPFYTDEYCDFAYCPNCEKGEFEFDTNTWEMKYCYECGQSIDWSDDK